MIVSRVIIDTQKLQALIREMDSPDAAVELVAQNLVAEIDEGWNIEPTGRIYDRGAYIHVASAPGETPAIELAALANSIRAEKLGEAEWAVRDGVEYGLDLEVGKPSENLEARPWLVPAVERVADSIPGVYREVIEEIV